MRVNRAVLSEILGVSEAGLTTLADQGLPVRRDGRGTEWDADPADCVAWLIQRERDRNTAPVAAQRARLLRLQADRVELEARQRAGELVVALDVARATGGAMRQVRDRVLVVPDRISPILAAATSAAEVHALLTAELRGALEEAVRRICEPAEPDQPPTERTDHATKP